MILITRDSDIRVWKLVGTRWVVGSPNSDVVIGRIVGCKVYRLTKSDRELLQNLDLKTGPLPDNLFGCRCEHIEHDHCDIDFTF